MSCAIRSCYFLEAPHLQKPWFLDTKEVSNKVLVRLNKWDYGLVRFACNRTLNFKKGTHELSNTHIMDKLCQLRNVACDKLFMDHAQQDSEEGKKGKKRKYCRVAKASDLVLLPEMFELDLPAIKVNDGRIIDGHITYALTEGVRSSNVYVELTTENMNYIHDCAANSTARGRHRRKADPQQVSIAEDDQGEALPEESVNSS